MPYLLDWKSQGWIQDEGGIRLAQGVLYGHLKYLRLLEGWMMATCQKTQHTYKVKIEWGRFLKVVLKDKEKAASITMFSDHQTLGVIFCDTDKKEKREICAM